MEKMNEENRYLNQYTYNSKKSRCYKKLYYGIEIFVLTATSLATVLIVIPRIPIFIPAIMTGSATLLKSISYLMGFQKKWINSRTITESLKSERLFFDMKIEKYKNIPEHEAKEIFVIQIENIVSEGNNVWLKIMQNDKKK